MTKTQPKTKPSTLPLALDIVGLLAAIAVLAAVSQHVDHLNQLAQQLMQSQAGHDYVSVRPDFQLVPLVPVALLVFVVGVYMRKRVSTLMLVSLTIFVSALAIGFFGIHLAHPGVTRF